jgi:hypothetical protein
MLVGHASPTHQYRYCRVAGCPETCQSNRVFRLKNGMCLRYCGEVNGAGRVVLIPGFFQQ